MGRVNLYSVTRVAETVTTGATGNIATVYPNDGYTYIVGACVNGNQACLRTWISSVSGNWFLTAIDPNSGNTINDASLNVRYLVLRIVSMS